MLANFPSQVFSPTMLSLQLLGSVAGIIIGALPGLGPVFALSLFLPLTFGMNPQQGIIFMTAIYASCVYGGAITAILINTPGTPGSVATALDGYEMTKKGQAGRALGAATFCSFIGGVIGVVALALLGPLLAEFSLAIGPAEYFMLVLAGLSLVAVAAHGDTIRGLIMAGLGLMLSFVGRDMITATDRLTFGTIYLQDGIKFPVFVIGVFALAQAMVLANEKGCIVQSVRVTGMVEGIKDVLRRPVVTGRSALLGTVLGIMPAVGISIANFVSYLVEKRSARDLESFGQGNVAGVIASETANNACAMAELIPAFGLGIPGGSSAALFLSVLMINGLNPGYGFFSVSDNFFAVIITGMLIAQAFFLIFGLASANYFARVVEIPNALLAPFVVVLCVIGAFAMRNLMLDVLVMIGAGVLGYYLIKYKYPISCLVLGMILGPLGESNFNRALRISQGSFSIFVSSPLSVAILIVIILALFYPYTKKALVYLRSRETPPQEGLSK